uniref:Selenoprotein S n=1 Tax=Scophthalmus maximus TaxID=52904 RepID=A0A8D3AUZ3_SCOMX
MGHVQLVRLPREVVKSKVRPDTCLQRRRGWLNFLLLHVEWSRQTGGPESDRELIYQWVRIVSQQETWCVSSLLAGELLSQYGWPLLLVSVLGYLLIQYLSKWISRQSSNSSAPQTPQAWPRRQEALEAARRKMQEELDAKAVIFKEKQKQQEEEKRRQKVELWESMKEGKSYKRTAKSPQTTEEASSSSTTVLKAKTDKKPLRSAGILFWRPRLCRPWRQANKD